jgi:hypothetical protein
VGGAFYSIELRLKILALCKVAPPGYEMARGQQKNEGFWPGGANISMREFNAWEQ